MITGDGARDRRCRADGVTRAGRKRQRNSFIGLDGGINRGINRDGRCGRPGRKGDCFTGSWCIPGVVRAVGRSRDAVVDGQSVGGGASAGV
jgi:hypothetical protein